MERVRAGYRIVTPLIAAAIAGCSSSSSLPFAAGSSPLALRVPVAQAAPHGGKIALSPKALALLNTGTVSTQTVTVSEGGYTGTFTETSTCKGKAAASPASGSGPKLKVKVTGVKAGSCLITFKDVNGNSAKLPVTVSTMAFKLMSVPAHGKSIEITLNTVNGKPPAANLQKTIVAALPACPNSCTVTGPQSPAGTDDFTLVVYDGPGASGAQIANLTGFLPIQAGVATVTVMTLRGIPHSVALVGNLPSGAANTPFPTAVGLTLSVKNADGDSITGLYAQPVELSDSDQSAPLGSGLVLTGSGGSCATASSSVGSISGTSFGLCYGGLDIPPATITASGPSFATVTLGTFSPAVQSIGYTGPSGSLSAREIDLYATSGVGSTGTWTDSQLGWTNSPYGKTIQKHDDCNNGTNAIATFAGDSFGTSWTATALGSPKVGTCTATLTGGGGATLAVTTTYSTTGFGVNVHHRSTPSRSR